MRFIRAVKRRSQGSQPKPGKLEEPGKAESEGKGACIQESAKMDPQGGVPTLAMVGL